MRGLDKTRGIEFYATRSDLEPILERIESDCVLQYVLAGLFSNPEPLVGRSGTEIRDLGISVNGASSLDDRYLVLDASVQVETRPVVQRRGGVLFCINAGDYPSSITFAHGGLYQKKCFIRGSLGTGSSHPDAILLYTKFRGFIRSQFVRVHADWLGKEALQYYRAGMRFTSDARGAHELDLPPVPCASTAETVTGH